MPALHGRGVGRLRVFSALLVLVLAATVAGCGGAAKGDFVASANAICASALRSTRSIPAPSVATGTAQHRALTGYVSQVLPIVQAEAAQFRHLRSSIQGAHDRAALAGYLGALTQTIVDYQNLAAAAKGDDAQGVASAEAALRANPAASLAARYGLRSCGIAGATVT